MEENKIHNGELKQHPISEVKSPFTGGNVVLISLPHKVKYQGETVEYIHEWYKCVDTGVTFTTTKLDEINLRNIKKKYEEIKRFNSACFSGFSGASTKNKTTMNEGNYNYYIRFNKLPEDGKSLVYENGIITGKREGVSVFGCRMENGHWYPTLPMPCTNAALEEFAMYTMYDDGKEHPMFLVFGKEIDRDEMNNPIITDVKILMEMNPDEIFPDRKTNLG